MARHSSTDSGQPPRQPHVGLKEAATQQAHPALGYVPVPFIAPEKNSAQAVAPHLQSAPAPRSSCRFAFGDGHSKPCRARMSSLFMPAKIAVSGPGFFQFAPAEQTLEICPRTLIRPGVQPAQSKWALTH